MKSLGRYSAAGFLLVLATTLGFWSFLDPAGQRSLLIAAGVALPVQIVAFALLIRTQRDPGKFLYWWALGVLGRMVVVLGMGLVVTQMEGVRSSVLILATAGFLFALLVMEPAFFDRTRDTAQFAP